MKRLLAPAVLAVLLTGCGGGKEAAVSSDVDELFGKAPTAEVAAKWPVAWCALSPSSTQDEIVAAMGEPTETFADSAKWVGFGYLFSVFYDEAGAVRQLDGSGDSDAQQSRIDCETTRTP